LSKLGDTHGGHDQTRLEEYFEAVDLEMIDHQAINLEAVNLETVNQEVVNLEAVNLEAVNLEVIGGRHVRWKLRLYGELVIVRMK